MNKRLSSFFYFFFYSSPLLNKFYKEIKKIKIPSTSFRQVKISEVITKKKKEKKVEILLLGKIEKIIMFCRIQKTLFQMKIRFLKTN
jgi:hypothetical protein